MKTYDMSVLKENILFRTMSESEIEEAVSIMSPVRRTFEKKD